MLFPLNHLCLHSAPEEFLQCLELVLHDSLHYLMSIIPNLIYFLYTRAGMITTRHYYSLEIQVCVRQYAVNGGSEILYKNLKFSVLSVTIKLLLLTVSFLSAKLSFVHLSFPLFSNRWLRITQFSLFTASPVFTFLFSVCS